jgi:pilus assembly protein Flp/PilA
MLYVYLWLKTWMNREEGQDLIEYVLITGLVALAAVATIILVGGNVNRVWALVNAQLTAIK